MSAGVPRSLWFWLLGLIFFFLALYLLRSILLPFVAGMAIAYLIDPWCDRLEARGLSRTWATTLVSMFFAFLVLLVLLLVAPLLVSQLTDFVNRVPGYLSLLQAQIALLTELVQTRVAPEILERMKDLIAGSSDKIGVWLTRFVTGLLSGGVAIANLLSLVVITPIVAFYLLRDWDLIIDRIDGWLPRDHAETIRGLMREIDSRMAGFLRGQGTVCLVLGLFYAIALSLIGLDFGLVIGLLAGFLSFIPFVGSITGFVAGVGLALIQFDNLLLVAIVAAVFLVGQALEGNILTPKLVGEKIGLHPVWVVFALLAGGALFGFVGVLLAVPIAAVAGVMARFAVQQYLKSSYYRGTSPPTQESGEP